MASAVINAKFPGLLDITRAMDPDGSPARVAMLLSQTNQLVENLAVIEGNLTTGHRSTMLAGLPDAIFRKFYGGVPESKAVNVQVDDTCGMMEAWSKADKDLVELNGNAAGFRLQQARAFIEAMNQKYATTFFYGDTTVDPEKFHGLAPRYSLSSATNGSNVLLGGGTTNLTSVWLITSSPETFHGIYPKGSTGGLSHEDLGLDTVLDTSNNPFRAYRDRFQWKCGLALPDWRYVVRICNIDVAALNLGTGTQALTAGTHIFKLMIKAIHRIPSMGMGNTFFLANRTVRQYLDIHAMDKSSSALAIMPAAEQFKTMFMGVPIYTCDAIAVGTAGGEVQIS